MNTILRHSTSAAMVLCAIAAFFVAAARAQEPAPPKEDKPAADNTFREQTIYIPYEKLRKVFEAKGRGVFLPYEEFQELWKAARERQKPPTDDRPPLDAVLSEIDNEGTVAGDVMQFKAKIKIELLTKGWHTIPLRLADAAITRATIGSNPARIIGQEGQGYQLLLEKREADPSTVELELEFAKAITRVPGRNQVALQVPQAPVSRWRITIPEPGVKLDIQPLLAASEVPDEKLTEPAPKESPKTTVVLAFVGAAPTVTIAWTPKTEGATGLAALATVSTQHQYRIHEGVARTMCELTYAISRAKLATLAVELPADQKVLDVSNANVRQWTVKKEGDKQRIDVQLFEPAEGTQSITIELEQFFKESDATKVTVPVVKALDVGRQEGLVVVLVVDALRAETAARSGLLQVDATELPPNLAGRKWEFAYRYAAVPFELTLAVEKVKPRVTVDSLTQVDLLPDRLIMAVSAVYTIERAGVFRFEWDVPEGFDVREVRGSNVGGAAEAQVDTYHATGDKKTRLVVNLARKALGRAGLLIRLEKNLRLPELLAPTGKSAEIPVVVPRVADAGIEDDRGRLVIRAPESLRVNAAKPQGLRAVSFAEALEGMANAPGPASNESRPVLAFALGRDRAELAISAERRKPQVTIGQLLSVRIEDDTVKYEAVFTYNVLYSGVKSLRIDVPEAIAERLHTQTAGIRERQITPPPADAPKGYQAWSYSGETEFSGTGRIKLVWEEKLEKLGLGQQVPVTIPSLLPAKADDAPIDRGWGQIVLVKAETIDLAPKDVTGELRPIDPEHDLMDGAKIPGAAQAFEYHGPWSMSVAATRYELQDVKHTSIENSVVRMVVTRADQVAVQAVYRLLSAAQRLEIELPKENVVFDTEPLRINGRPVTLERGAEGRFFAPLAGASADRPIVLDLRYTIEKDAGNVLALPEFPEKPAIQKVRLCVYLPDEVALLGTRGPWTSEVRWRLEHTLNFWRPVYLEDDAAMVAELAKDVAMTGNPTEGFETDGRRYVFSTLRPTGPLELVKMNETLLTVIVLAVVVLGGVLLVTASIKTRVLAVGALVAAVVLCGVFAPLMARQILDGYFIAAMVIVAVVWTVVAVYRHRPQPKPTEAPPAVASAPPVQPPAATSAEPTPSQTSEGGKTNVE